MAQGYKTKRGDRKAQLKENAALSASRNNVRGEPAKVIAKKKKKRQPPEQNGPEESGLPP